MRVVGIGETVLDIVFDSNNQPLSAKPGGSVFNAMISVARDGKQAAMITETGDDLVGRIINGFLAQNGVDDSLVTVNEGCQSHLALAFLDDEKKANYEFYKFYSDQKIRFAMPNFEPGDCLLFGSYFAINPSLRADVLPVLQAARQGHALLYYDINFRATHSDDAYYLWPTIAQNIELAHIVKCSDEDLQNLFGTSDWRGVYRDEISSRCPYFICTQGSAGATLLTPEGEFHVAAPSISPVSTIGAGDSFNAGTLCGLIDQGLTAASLSAPNFCERLLCAMHRGVDFATEVCQTLDNYISKR